MKIIGSKNISIGKKLLLSYFALLLTVVLISGIFTAPLVQDLVEERIKKELETTIDVFHNLAKTTAQISIENHLRTIVETNIDIIQELANKADKGLISSFKAKQEAEKIFSTQTIGQTGYIYVLDKSANLVFHPKTGVKNQNVYEFKFVRTQLENPSGYLEYKWKNPEDKIEKDKALYFRHFEKWGWIISASSYKSEFSQLVKAEDLKINIESLKFGESGYAFLMDTHGKLLIHPKVSLKNINNINPPEGKNLYHKIIEEQTGKIEYDWKNPGDENDKQKIVYFKYLKEFDLIIAASGYKAELYSPVYKMAYIFIGSLFFLLACIVPLTFWLSRSITKPLETFIEKIQYASRGNLNVRIPEDTPGEIAKLAKYFNVFMEELSIKTKKLQGEIDERKSREEQVRVLAKFPDDNPNPVMRVTKSHILAYFNQAAMENLKTIDLKIGLQIPEEFIPAIDKAFKTGKPTKMEYLDSKKVFSFSISPFQDINSAYIYGQEITAQKAYESLLVLSDAFFENSIEGICITDTNGTIKRVNPIFTEITGYTEEEAIGNNPRLLKSDKHDEEFYTKMWETIKQRGQWSGEIWNRRKNGQAYPEWLTISAIKDEKGDVVNYISVFHDITEYVLNKEKIHYQTYHDATTGLPNRKLFADIIGQSVNFSEKRKDNFAILFIDINNFKNINDSLGHIVGDNLLFQFAEKLKNNIPKEMVIARFVGDKFTILLPNTKDQAQALKEASNIQKIIHGPYIIDGKEIFCGTNIGISFYPQDGTKAETLIKNAEMAMYRGKNKGKRSISFYTSAMDQMASERLETEHKLVNALNNDEFQLYFQPKVNLITGKIVGAEALIRWVRENEIISPGLFIPVAEETGFIIPIGEWVIKTVCTKISEWKKFGHKNVPVSLNLSGVQLQDSSILEMIKDEIAKNEISPESLKFEITESVVMADPELASLLTSEIKKIGSKISIDDFGTGYSSLGYLKKFPIDELKIDKSFLDDFPESEGDIAIIRAILSLAGNLNLNVVAEGVEREVQLETLRTLGCDEIQGYYFSRPLPEEEFIKLLDSGKRLKQIKTL